MNVYERESLACHDASMHAFKAPAHIQQARRRLWGMHVASYPVSRCSLYVLFRIQCVFRTLIVAIYAVEWICRVVGCAVLQKLGLTCASNELCLTEPIFDYYMIVAFGIDDNLRDIQYSTLDFVGNIHKKCLFQLPVMFISQCSDAEKKNVNKAPIHWTL